MPALSCNCLQKKHEVGLFDGGVKNNSHPERRMKGGVEGRTEGGSDQVLLFVVCTMRGGWWEGLEKVGVPHKKCFFSPSLFPSG